MTPPSLTISLLGHPQFSEQGRAIEGFNSNKTRALLAYVAAHAQPLSRSSLATLLWGDMPEERAATNLRKSLTNLRKLVGDYLAITRQTVGMSETAVINLDINAFQALANNVDEHHRLEQAIALYQGDFMAGVYIKNSIEFEGWQLGLREQLRIKAIECLHLLSTRHVPWLTLEQAIGYANQLLQLEPWREETHRQLMILQARNNQMEAVAIQYARCKKILQAELGIPVSKETKRLYEQLTTQHTRFQAVVPTSTTAIVGRETELATLEALLMRPGIRLVSILGTGGMGKTRLAIAAAERFVEQEGNGRFWDGVFFIDLTPLQDSTHLSAHILQAMGFAQSETQQNLHDSLSEKQLLLILDNFEHLLDGTHLIAKLLQACPQLVVLVTSREKLRLREEQILPLEGVAYEMADAIAPAQQLFVAFAQRLQPHFGLSPETEPLVNRICQLLAGMPLAIELAATWIDTLSLADIVAELQDGLDILTADLHNIPDRHRNIEAVFEATWQRLPTTSQQRFNALTIFQGGFTLAAAKTVTDVTVRELAHFVNHALLKLDQPNRRYQLHPLLQQFGYAKLFEAETAVLQTRHAHFYLEWIEQQLNALHHAKPKEAADTIEADWGNIQLAWETAVFHNQFTTLEKASLAIAEFLHLRYGSQEAAPLFQTAAQAAATQNQPASEGYFLAHLARRRNTLSQHNGTHDLFQRAFTLLQTTNDPHKIAYCLLHWSHLFFQQGKSNETLDKLQQALTYCQRTDNPILFSQIMNRLGIVYGHIGDYQRAHNAFHTALEVAEAEQNINIVARAIHHIGIVHCLQKEFKQGAVYFHQALALAKEQDLFESINTLLVTLGELQLDLENPKEAEAYFDQGLRVALERNYIPSLIRVQLGLGRAKQLQNRYEEAKIHLQRSLEGAQKHQMMASYAEAKLWLSIVTIKEGQI
ncbi:MAG: tetratricopeptide repeat protein, partial [Chloroflexota bacterium]